KRGSRKIDGNGVMVKIKTIPKGTRSQSWMGPPDLKNYTISADVRTAMKDGKMPDVGLIGQRYTFDMMGASQQLQIRTWPPQLRMAKTVPFQWKPNVWYRMKMKTSVENGKAVLRGKVWERDKKEPKGWLLEAFDPVPNRTGSPGLFGNAKDAEIFYDNIVIQKNK
ncbi:probable serine/threonine protein kinase related protein, partial [hydrothermal vent metagenome]